MWMALVENLCLYCSPVSCWIRHLFSPKDKCFIFLSITTKQQIPNHEFKAIIRISQGWSIYIVLRKEMLARLYNVYRRFNRQEASEYSVCNVDRSVVNDNGDMRNRLNTAQDETHQQVLTQSSKETGNVLSQNWN